MVPRGSLTRRRLLRAAPFVVATVAGCATGGDSTTPIGSDSPTPTPSATPTPTTARTPTFDLSRLALSAEFVGPATTERPFRVRATLENTSDEPIELGYGVPPLFPTGGFDAVDRPIAFFPAQHDGERVDGCWRPGGAQHQFTPRSHIEWRPLSPGETVTGDIDLYTMDSSTACLPAGEYTFEGGLFLIQTDAIRLPVVVTVGSDGGGSVTAGELSFW